MITAILQSATITKLEKSISSVLSYQLKYNPTSFKMKSIRKKYMNLPFQFQPITKSP